MGRQGKVEVVCTGRVAIRQLKEYQERRCPGEQSSSSFPANVLEFKCFNFYFLNEHNKEFLQIFNENLVALKIFKIYHGHNVGFRTQFEYIGTFLTF